MTFCVENESGKELSFDVEEIAGKVIEEALEYENCPYEVIVDVLLCDNEGIHVMNREHRGIDRPTDVLSFPLIDYKTPGDFSIVESAVSDYFNPESGELLLGDIVISIDKVYEQAREYNHSVHRELAFLVAHSMLHLFGYDHMEDEERILMEKLQEKILTMKGYTRDYEKI